MDFGHWIDFVICTISVILELPFVASLPGGFIIVARLWRFLRVAEGAVKGETVFEEIVHGSEIEEVDSEEDDEEDDEEIEARSEEKSIVVMKNLDKIKT